MQLRVLRWILRCRNSRQRPVKFCYIEILSGRFLQLFRVKPDPLRLQSFSDVPTLGRQNRTAPSPVTLRRNGLSTVDFTEDLHGFLRHESKSRRSVSNVCVVCCSLHVFLVFVSRAAWLERRPLSKEEQLRNGLLCLFRLSPEGP